MTHMIPEYNEVLKMEINFIGDLRDTRRRPWETLQTAPGDVAPFLQYPTPHDGYQKELSKAKELNSAPKNNVGWKNK